VKVGEKTEALVYPKRGDSWRIVYLDRPTARYQFRRAEYGKRVAHKISMSEMEVSDRESSEILGRYRRYGRFPPWFWIGLGTPGFACDEPGRWPLTRGNILIFEEVLMPAVQK
jgi:hypothetical protein